MYYNVSPALALGTTGAATTGVVSTTTGMFTNPIWAVLAGFAILAAFTALARVVPRRGTLAKGDPMRRLEADVRGGGLDGRPGSAGVDLGLPSS